MTRALDVARLGVFTLAVGSISWGLVAGAPAATRASAAPRDPGPVGLVVRVDGLVGHLSVPSDRSLREAFGAVGLDLGPTDRLSVDAAAPVARGMRVSVDRGVPVTLIDGGQQVGARAGRGTVAELLGARGIALGPLDVVEPAAHGPIEPGMVVRVSRIAEIESTAVEAIPFGIHTLRDVSLEAGRWLVEVPGVAGQALRTYRIRYVDGALESRALLAESDVREPSDEVRRVGTRIVPPPAPPAEIERIIRDAAAKWGADPVQLLRVAWCESRYDPRAYNPSAGDSGLFQFIPGTWVRNSPRASFAGASPFDPVANAQTAAMLFSEGKSWMWTCK